MEIPNPWCRKHEAQGWYCIIRLTRNPTSNTWTEDKIWVENFYPKISLGLGTILSDEFVQKQREFYGDSEDVFPGQFDLELEKIEKLCARNR